jgi:xylulokinase
MVVDTVRFIGIDIGTEGLKVVALSSAGRVITRVVESYHFDVPQPGWAEQDPEVWWNACLSALHQLRDSVDLSSVEAIGIAGQMHSAVLLDQSGKPLFKALLWNDQRSSEAAAYLEQLVTPITIKDFTGNRILPGFTASKIQWIKQHHPEVFKRISTVMMPKDYIAYLFTGNIQTDVTDASGTALFNVVKRQWSNELITAFGFRKEWFPDAYESQSVIGRVSPAAAKLTGFREGTPVIAGAADNAATGVGVGIVRPRQGFISIGTSGVVFMSTDDPSYFSYSGGHLSSLHNFCHAYPNMWYSMGVTLAAGSSLRWLRDTLSQAGEGGTLPYEKLTKMAEHVPVGSDGLLFLPYLAGERTPHVNPRARGVFFGLSFHHGAGHMIRSTMEGVGYSILDCLMLLKQVCSLPAEMKLAGGIVRSNLWCQIMSDIVGLPLHVLSHEGAAEGVALLAGLSVGAFDTGMIENRETQGVFMPIADHTIEYRTLYEKYNNLYRALASQF